MLYFRNLSDALKSYNKAVELKPDFAEAYNNKGNVLRKLNKKEDAIENYLKATKFNKNHIQAYYNLGCTFRELKKYSYSIENFEKVLKLKPDYLEAYLGLGNLHLELKQNDLALECYEKALKIKPDYSFLPGNILHIKLKLCLWDNLDKDLKDLENKVLNLKKISLPFPLLTFNNSLKLQKISSEIWANQFKSKDKNILKESLKSKIIKKLRLDIFLQIFMIMQQAT